MATSCRAVFWKLQSASLLSWLFVFGLVVGPQGGRAQSPPSYGLCLRFAQPSLRPRGLRLNQHPPQKILADTCLRVPYSGAGETTLLVEAEGCFAQSVRLRPDTLRGPLRLTLLPREVALQDVVVRSASAARYRGDTLILRVDSVRTQPHASATDLLNNLAGASVDAAGQVRVLGKTVDRVTVEGKPLYGGNPKAALEALNADMIKNLELSEVAGGDGGTTLNVRLKEDHQTGSYGRVEGRVGTAGTYAAAGRVSRVRAGNFLSAFATANNVYEQALTADDQTALVRNSVQREVQGAYSVTETALPRPSSVQADRNVQNLVEAPLNVGQTRTVNGGLNYNQAGARAEVFGYVLADHTRQALSRTFRTTRFLDPYRQQEDGTSADDYTRAKATGYLNGKWTLTPRQTLTTASLLGWRRQTTALASTLATTLTQDTATLTRARLERQLTSQEQYLVGGQQAAWVKRYERPAQLTSLYGSVSWASHRTEQQYANQVQTGGASRLFHNRLVRRDQSRSWELQALHAQPLTRRLLLEAKLTWSYEAAPQSQQGYRLSGTTEYYEPGLSLGDFRGVDQQQTARVALYYKTPRFSALLSPTLWRWASERQAEEQVLFAQQRLLFVPAFFVEYRPEAATKFSLRYGQSPLLPAPERLFPVPDSANVQFIRVGNPRLGQTQRRTLEATAASALGNNRFTLTARYGADDSPVLLATQPNALGFLTQTYRQPDWRVPAWGGSLLWFQLNQLKSYSLHAFATGQWLRNYLFTQQQATELRTFLGVVVAGVKWKGPQGTALKLDWRTTLTQQQAADGPPMLARNLRHEPVLACEKKWGARLYTELTTTAALTSYAQGPTTANVLLDATLSRYFLRGDCLKLAVLGRNLLNNIAYQTNSFAGSIQKQETVGRLPRFVQVGLSFFPERWQ